MKHFIFLASALLAVPAARALDFDGRFAAPGLSASLAQVQAPALRAPFPADTDPYLADKNADIIFAWLSGDVAGNMALLQAWTAENGIDDGVVEFMFHKKYAGARARFVMELNAGAVGRRGKVFPVNTDPYLADQASEVIFAWLNSDPQANMPAMLGWMAGNGISDSPAEFMFH